MTASPPNHPTPAIAETRWYELRGTLEAVVVRSAGVPGETRMQLQWVPRTRCHGTVGWSWAGDGQGTRRIHVCAHSLCIAPDNSTFGLFAELPVHVRRVFVDSGACRSEASLTEEHLPASAPPPAAPAEAPHARCFRKPTHVRALTWIEMWATQCVDATTIGEHLTIVAPSPPQGSLLRPLGRPPRSWGMSRGFSMQASRDRGASCAIKSCFGALGDTSTTATTADF